MFILINSIYLFILKELRTYIIHNSSFTFLEHPPVTLANTIRKPIGRTFLCITICRWCRRCPTAVVARPTLFTLKIITLIRHKCIVSFQRAWHRVHNPRPIVYRLLNIITIGYVAPMQTKKFLKTNWQQKRSSILNLSYERKRIWINYLEKKKCIWK